MAGLLTYSIVEPPSHSDIRNSGLSCVHDFSFDGEFTGWNYIIETKRLQQRDCSGLTPDSLFISGSECYWRTNAAAKV